MPIDPEREHEWEAALRAERERLEGELATFATRDPKMRGDWDSRFPAVTVEQGTFSHAAQDEQADFREEFETTLAQEHALEFRLREVDAALERLRSRTFGLCRACGQPISEARLRANPAAAYDIEHQPREEA